MTRTHRNVHRWLWPVLAALVGALFLAALVMRPPPEKSASAALPNPPAKGVT